MASFLRSLPYFARRFQARKPTVFFSSISKCVQLEAETMPLAHGSKKGNIRFASADAGSAPSPEPAAVPVNTSSHFKWTIDSKNVNTSDPMALAKGIFFNGLENVIPSKLITSQLQLQGALLKLENEECTTIDLSQYNKKYVVGFGKACLPMAETLLLQLNGLIDRCIVSVPIGSRPCRNSSIEVHYGAKDNIPDAESFAAARAIVDLVQHCTKNDLLFVLISGGGSALLPYPIPPVTLEEKQELIRSLSRAGCTINEMNTVRKRLSLVKGGGLVEMCGAGRIISLIVSDVVGSPLDIIASGPTVENYDLSDEALNVIKKYNLADQLPESIRTITSSPPEAIVREKFDRVTNFIIGDNRIALEAAAATASKFGLHPFIVSTNLSGEAADVGYDLANMVESFAFFINNQAAGKDPEDSDVKSHSEAIKSVFKRNGWSTTGILPEIMEEHARPSKGICLLFGGETTVTVHGKGKGGRNQELALSAGIRLDLSRNSPNLKDKVAILSAGTDGFDGPNNRAAGAIIEGPTIHNSQLQGLSPVTYLKENDSFNFFENASNGKYHIICGHTETNVMDLVVIVILKKSTTNPSKGNL